MCGIVGYLGKNMAAPILIDGLKRLEYRGYDSSGIAVLEDKQIVCYKSVGKIAKLSELIADKSLTGSQGIAHTRWATHGVPSEVNAHPHFDCQKKIAVVHNGIIENFAALKLALQGQGHNFLSQTDTEVLAHLIEKNLPGNSFLESVRLSLKEVQGTYGLVVMSQSEPGKLIVAKKGSPLVIGVGEGEYVIASDVSAIVSQTKKVIYLEDFEIAEITNTSHQVFNVLDGSLIDKKIDEVNWSLEEIEKGGFETFMLKEINEQPQSISNALLGRLDNQSLKVELAGLEQFTDRLNGIKRIIMVACGTSWHAGLVSEFIFENLLKLPTEVEYASEFRYRNPIIGPDCLAIFISQSGETADTLAALELAKEAGALTLAVCNVVGSSIARKVDHCLYLQAGPEIGVASTKAFTTQLTVLSLLAIYLSRQKNGPENVLAGELAEDLASLPKIIKDILKLDPEIRQASDLFVGAESSLYLGRGVNYPVALEGALKLKEISYVHAEGYPAGEMKHGPIALVDPALPVVFLVTKDKDYDKTISNVMEIKARGGKILALATIGDTEIANYANQVIYLPKISDLLMPIINVIPLQSLAYYVARTRDCDVDKPRNLAKSVTVE